MTLIADYRDYKSTIFDTPISMSIKKDENFHTIRNKMKLLMKCSTLIDQIASFKDGMTIEKQKELKSEFEQTQDKLKSERDKRCIAQMLSYKNVKSPVNNVKSPSNSPKSTVNPQKESILKRLKAVSQEHLRIQQLKASLAKDAEEILLQQTEIQKQGDDLKNLSNQLNQMNSTMQQLKTEMNLDKKFENRKQYLKTTHFSIVNLNLNMVKKVEHHKQMVSKYQEQATKNNLLRKAYLEQMKSLDVEAQYNEDEFNNIERELIFYTFKSI